MLLHLRFCKNILQIILLKKFSEKHQLSKPLTPTVPTGKNESRTFQTQQNQQQIAINELVLCINWSKMLKSTPFYMVIVP